MSNEAAKAKQPTLAKISRPHLSGTIDRKALFRLLDRNASTPVTWISGPPGAGKTTLVSRYLDASDQRALWYQLDDGDSDPATFFYYLGKAADAVVPDAGKPLPLLTSEFHSGITTFSRQYFQALYEKLTPGCTLVFDDYQEVSGEAPFHELMREAFTQLPAGNAGIRCIVISRGMPPACMARLRANGVIQGISGEELELNASEIKAIAKARSAKKLSAEEVSALKEQTQGWVAGLILLLDRPKTARQSLHDFTDSDPSLLFHYFSSEILEQTDPAIRKILLETALLPRATQKMAEELTQEPSAGTVLEEFDNRNYFINRRTSGETVYQFHPLFREFLLTCLKQETAKNRLRELRLRAASVLQASGQYEDAVQLLRAAEEWKVLAPVIQNQAPHMLAQGRIVMLQDWLSCLPKESFEDLPWLLHWRGACKLLVDPTAARLDFEKAFFGFQRLGETTSQLFSWAALADTFFFAWTCFEGLDPWIEELERLMEAHPELLSTENGPGPFESLIAPRLLNCLTFRQPDNPSITHWEDRTHHLAQSDLDPGQLVVVAAALSHRYFFIGEFERSRLLMDQLRPSIEHVETSPLIRLAWQLADSVTLRNTFAFEQAVEELQKGLEFAKATGVHVMDMRLLAQCAYSAICIDDFDGLHEILEEIRDRLNDATRLDLVYFNDLSAFEASRRGEHQRARAHAEAAVRYAENVGAPFPYWIAKNSVAQTLMDDGELDAAEELFQSIAENTRRIHASLLEFIALCSLAYIALQRDPEGAAIPLLREAFALGSKQNHVSVLWWRRKIFSPLCAAALKHGIEEPYVRDLILKRNLSPTTSAYEVDSWSWPLKIYTLGKFEVIRHESDEQLSKKVRQRPLDLLKVLLASGKREVSSEHIIEILWPLADGDAAHRSLDTTLHRLRRWLGSERYIVNQSGRLSIDTRCCWVDAWALEDILDSLSRTRPHEEPAPDWSRMLDKLFDLYQGAFLESERESWILTSQDRLQNKLLRGVLRIGTQLETEARWDEAAECYQRGIDAAPRYEELYQRLMLVLEKQGRPAEAIEVYLRCTSALEANLGVTPSEATDQISKRLRRSQPSGI